MVWLARLTLLVCLGVSAGVTAMLAAHRSAQPILGPYSFAALAALILASFTAIAFAALVILPDRSLSRFLSWLVDGSRALRVTVPRGNSWTGLALAILAAAAYAAIAFRLVEQNRDPLNDQYDYLRVAVGIRELGGAAELWGQLWSGEYREANRHPLYTLIVSIRPEFEWGKRLSLVMGIGVLAAVWVHTTCRAGWVIGGLSAVLLATNAVFQQSASLVACEMLFILWAFIAWIAIERIVEREDQPLANSWTRVWYPVLVGVALGLGYLTKASAVFLLVGFLGWSVSLPGLRRWSWLTLVAFAVVASPLLIRNTRAYGDPFYSVNNRFLFSDTFEEGLDREFFGTWPAAKEYWSTHTIGGMAKRLFTGLGWEGYVLLRSLGPVTSSNSSVLVGLVVLLLAILGSMGWDRRIVGAALSWLIPFFVFFAWYGVIARGDRFLAPLVPIMLISAARGAAVLLQTGAPASDRALARRVVLTAVLWCVATVAMSWRLARQLPVVPEAVGSVPTMPDEWRSSR